MRELQVPTRQITVDVHTSDGQRIHGAFFVAESPYQTGAPEDVIEVLNDPRAFLPFVATNPEEGQPLLNKHHVSRVCLDDGTHFEAEHDSDDVTLAAPCTMVLRDGTRLNGRLFAATPASASRLVDKMNQVPRFVPFLAEDGMQFVNIDHVLRVY